MRTALQCLRLGAHGDIPRYLHFDVRDNYKDIVDNAGLIGSAQAAVQAELAGISHSTAPISVADSSGTSIQVRNESTQNINMIDPGAIAGAVQIAQDALRAGTQNVADASRTILEAFERNTDLAKQAQAGPTAMIVKLLGWVAVAGAALWAAVKIFGGKKS